MSIEVPSSIAAIERPHPNLWRCYLIRSILSGPLIIVVLPLLYFRYHTLRYRFDGEGIHMQWGMFFRREVNLTYARIQDIHLTSGPVQRWLRLADVHIQTASGSAAAEMKIEGVMQYLEVRDFLYSRMRGYRKGRQRVDEGAVAVAPTEVATATTGSGELAQQLRAVAAEIRGARVALERLARDGEDGDV